MRSRRFCGLRTIWIVALCNVRLVKSCPSALVRELVRRLPTRTDLRTGNRFIQVAWPAGCPAGHALRLVLTSSPFTPGSIGRLLLLYRLLIDQLLTLRS